MPTNLKLKDAQLLSLAKKGAKGTAVLRCAFTEEIKDSMAWGDLPDWLSSGQPEGDLAAILLKMKPKASEQAHNAFDLNISRVHGFVITRIEPKGKNAKAKGKDTVLQLKIDFRQADGAAILETYLNVVGDTKSSAVISYQKQETLPGLPGPDATQDQKEATAPKFDLVDPDGVVQ